MAITNDYILETAVKRKVVTGLQIRYQNADVKSMRKMICIPTSVGD